MPNVPHRHNHTCSAVPPCGRCHSRHQTTSSSHAQTEVAPFVYGDRVQFDAAGRRAKGSEISCAIDHHEYRTAALLGSWASGLFSRIQTHVHAALGPLISVDQRGGEPPKVDRSLLSQRPGSGEYAVVWMPSIRCKGGRTHAVHVVEGALSPTRPAVRGGVDPCKILRARVVDCDHLASSAAPDLCLGQPNSSWYSSSSSYRFPPAILCW